MIGAVFGNFQVVGELGRGGMGEVWLAEHKDLKTRVAIKILLPQISADQAQVGRFFNEAIAVSLIKHAGIAKIFDSGFRDGAAYLVMEYLEGEPLAKRIVRLGQLPQQQIVDIARQIASVLEATHAAGIIHRDLKPDNVFIVPDAELASGERVKVLDFGIAKLTGDLATGPQTATKGSMGTPAYMSPEQWRASAQVDGRADVYSLGCLIFEMACGRPPFLAESIGQACDLHLNAEPPALSSLRPDLSPRLEDLVKHLLAKAADLRPGMRDIKTAFAAMGAGGHLTASHAVVATTTAAKAIQAMAAPTRSKRWPLAAGALVLVAGAATVFAVTRGGDSDGTPQVAASGSGPLAPAGSAQPPSPSPSAPPPPSAPPSPSPSSSPSVSATAAAAEAHVHITTTPATAELRIDGALVDNPFDGGFPKGDLSHRIDVHAPGFHAETRMITYAADRTVEVALVREASHVAVVPPPPPTRPPPAQPAAPLPAVQPPQAGSNSDDKRNVYKGTKLPIMTTYPPR